MERRAYVLPLCVVFSALLWATLAQTALTCRSCIHVDYGVTGIPPVQQFLLKFMVKKYNLHNPPCDGEQATTPMAQTCAPGVSKCRTINVHFNMRGVLHQPNARMNATVVARSCGEVTDQGAETCTGFNEENQKVRGILKEALLMVEALSKHRTYKGQMCLKSP